MKNDFLVFSAHKMIDDVRSGRVSSRVAEPFGTYKALDYRCWRMNSAVTRQVKCQKILS